MTKVAKLVYTGKMYTAGGRENGTARSSDGRLDVVLSNPSSASIGTNPEQLFAAAWSASFNNAVGLVARKRKLALPAEAAVDAEVDLNLAKHGYFISTRLNISLPGVDLSRNACACASGIEIISGEDTRTIRASREIVLATGKRAAPNTFRASE